MRKIKEQEKKKIVDQQIFNYPLNWRKTGTIIYFKNSRRKVYRKTIARNRKYQKQKSIYELVTEYMQQPKYYVEMDSRSIQEVFKKYSRSIQEVFKKYSRNTHYSLKWKTFLVLDNSSSNNTINGKENLKECKTDKQMISSSLTFKLQPWT